MTRHDPMRDPPPLPLPRRTGASPRTALLVNPFYRKDPVGSSGKHVLTPSLALTSLAAATPAGWGVRFWDENLLQGPPSLDPLPQVVGITVQLTQAERAYELGAWFRAQGSLVVMGGPHALSCPEEVGEHCDVLAVGNGALTWPRILRDLEWGKAKPRYEAAFADFGSEPWPDRSVLPGDAFLTPLSLMATRGCHNRCDFCFLSTGPRLRYEVRPVEDVAAEFAESRAPYGVFLDNNLGASRHYLRRLCRALAPLEKIWSAAVTIDVTEEPDLVREMALSGCTGVFVGFESLAEENLRAAGKRAPPAEDLARRIDMFQRNGIQVNGSFVFGFDGDGPEVFERTARWIEAVRLECATFHILTPYPRTPLFRRLESEGRLLHRDWSRYDTAHAVFRPKRMTPEELEAGRRWVYRRIFSARSIWRRRPREASAVLPYLAMAFLYKRADPLWRFLIRHRLTHAAWSPLVHLSRRRHLRLRARLARECARPEPACRPNGPVPLPVPPGV